ncbi:hypothetical protein [Paenibacillus sp. NAIST15-1]|uniref:hypothetical protein n=1 Tax=Paenibacillus sp. NAIST15-1 TaxID=1605994 RepID=UPI00086AE6C6|nr:hypothetical protein [Paenibacillus sp. NAIST15-1]GAV11342.1 hypothetical protein PBN151_1269 [Paenibacillus sp. NAIST15-1]
MRLRNKLIKTVAQSEELRSKFSLYSTYKEPDIDRTRFVLTDSTDIVICNEEEINNYLSAGFSIFGSAQSNEEVDAIISRAEVS